MEEKKTINVRLSTVIYSIIILLLIGAIVFFVIQNNDLRSQQIKNEREIQELQQKEQELQNITNEAKNKDANLANNIINNETVNSNIGSNSNSDNNVSENKANDMTNEITSTLPEGQIFYVKEAKKEGGKYVLRGEIYETPYTISRSECERFVKDGKIKIKAPGYSEELAIRRIASKEEEEFPPQSEYVVYPKKFPDAAHYVIRPLGAQKYYIESMGDFSAVYKLVEESRTITVDSNTKCTYSLDSYEDKTDTVANVFSKKLYFEGCFNFSFKNGKCISVNEIVIGH